MATMFSSMFGRTKPYEPSPRFRHYAAPVGGRCFLWGGRVSDFSARGRKKLASTAEIFDPYVEVWEQQATSGVLPPGLYGGACASLSDLLYSFGGYDGASFYNSLHMLDPTSLEWKELRALNETDGPMRKNGCGMAALNRKSLAFFGGYGIPTGPTQPGTTFFKNISRTDGSGWSNELHIFNISEDKWSIPSTTGPRPPPCFDFSFTSVSDHLAILYGGYQPGHRGRVNDCYLINFETMEWTKLKMPEGAPWPLERDSHAACCLNYGQDYPQVLVAGGLDNNYKTLHDTWILDVESGRWRELTLPQGAQPRTGHTVTAISLGPGRTQVIMFGGCPKWERGKSVDAWPKLAETTVLEFESVETSSSGGGPPIREWVLVGVAGSSQLGSVKRMRNMVNRQRQALQEAQQALDTRVQDAEARAQDLQMQLEASQYAYQESQLSLQASQAEKRDLQVQLEASQAAYSESQQSFQASQAEKRDLQVQLEASQAAYRESQQASQAEKQNLQQSVDEANVRVESLQRRVQNAEHRAEEAEWRAHDAGQVWTGMQDPPLGISLLN